MPDTWISLDHSGVPSAANRPTRRSPLPCSPATSRLPSSVRARLPALASRGRVVGLLPRRVAGGVERCHPRAGVVLDDHELVADRLDCAGVVLVEMSNARDQRVDTSAPGGPLGPGRCSSGCWARVVGILRGGSGRPADRASTTRTSTRPARRGSTTAGPGGRRPTRCPTTRRALGRRTGCRRSTRGRSWSAPPRRWHRTTAHWSGSPTSGRNVGVVVARTLVAASALENAVPISNAGKPKEASSRVPRDHPRSRPPAPG